MDLRDPAIASWINIDPVTHHSQSTYNAFDGNPVSIADPSGADGMVYGMAGQQAWSNPNPRGYINYGNATGLNVAKARGNYDGNTWAKNSIGFWGTERALEEQSWEAHENNDLSIEINMDDVGEATHINLSTGLVAQISLLPESFDFQKTSSNWQAAGVTGLSLTVSNLFLETKSVNFQIEVGVPIELKNGATISKRLAATASAEAANQTAATIGTMADLTKGRFYDSPALVQKAFSSVMQRNLNIILGKSLGVPKSQVGSRVNSPIQSNIIPREAVWGNISVFQQLQVWIKGWF